ncbi:hypothetical protein BC831DRAFT_442921 [Entophlyctis helioformis]|nr:hypothetical protein BC831DRAFT_442921 [Entophlyctis helioformis]
MSTAAAPTPAAVAAAAAPAPAAAAPAKAVSAVAAAAADLIPTKAAPVVDTGIKVFVGNLKPKVAPDAIKAFFAPAGNVEQVRVIRKSSTRPAFGFVSYATLAEAEKAVALFDKKTFDELELTVQMAQPKATTAAAAEGPAGAGAEGKKRNRRTRKVCLVLRCCRGGCQSSK